MSHNDNEAAEQADKDEANRHRLDGDWGDADKKARKTWGDRPAEPPAQEPSTDQQLMDHTEEGYGTGKDGADPQADKSGALPDKPVV